MWNGLENSIVAYADDTTLFSPILSPNHRVLVSESINRDLERIYSWCCTWGMLINPNKSQSVIFGRSRLIQPLHPPLVINNISIETTNKLSLLGVLFDIKLTFETHIRNTVSSIAYKTGLLRKCYKNFSESDTVLKTFYAFILPFYEYCSMVWSSSADTHLRLLDRSVGHIKFLLPNFNIDLEHRRNVAALSFLFKIINNQKHPLRSLLPAPYHSVRNTRFSSSQHSLSFSFIRFNTTQFSRSFILKYTTVWNTLPEYVVQSSDVTTFKKQINNFLKAQSI